LLREPSKKLNGLLVEQRSMSVFFLKLVLLRSVPIEPMSDSKGQLRVLGVFVLESRKLLVPEEVMVEEVMGVVAMGVEALVLREPLPREPLLLELLHGASWLVKQHQKVQLVVPVSVQLRMGVLFREIV